MGACITDNKAIVTRYLEEIVNRGTFQVADEISATHTGKAAGGEPTGEKISGELIHLWRVLDGRLAEGWYFGTPELMRRVFAAVSAT